MKGLEQDKDAESMMLVYRKRTREEGRRSDGSLSRLGMSPRRVMRRQQTGDTGMLRQYSSNRAGREARSQRNGRREGGIEELTVKGHGSSDAGDPDKGRNGDDWTGGEAEWPR